MQPHHAATPAVIPPAVRAAVNLLSHRQCVAALRELAGGRPIGFDYARASIETVRDILAQRMALANLPSPAAALVMLSPEAAPNHPAPVVQSTPEETMPPVTSAPANPFGSMSSDQLRAMLAETEAREAAEREAAAAAAFARVEAEARVLREAAEAAEAARVEAAEWEALQAAAREKAEREAAEETAMLAAAEAAAAAQSPVDVTPAPADVTPAPVASPSPFADPDAAFDVVAAAELFPDYAKHLPEDLRLRRYTNARPDVPASNPDYRFNPAQLVFILRAMSVFPTQRILLSGAPGTGKTAAVTEIAARCNRPLFRVNFDRTVSAEDVIGGLIMRDGNTEWQAGPVAAACMTPGAILLLDEISGCPAGVALALNPLLERAGAAVRAARSDSLIKPCEDLMIFAADNTLLRGDTSGGSFPGRGVLGSDFVDRLGFVLQFDYLTAAEETKLLQRVVARDTGLKMRPETAAACVNLVAMCREKSTAGEMAHAVTFRALSAFAVALAFGVAPADAWRASVILKAPEEYHETLRQLFAAATDFAAGNPAQFFA